MTIARHRVTLSRLILLATFAATMILTLSSLVPAASSEAATPRAKPTIVLVHGAFADSSSWNGTIERLQKRGYTAYAPANPLRGLVSDSAYLRAFLGTIPGPVILAGHSYGGAVISNAATGNPAVKGLVFIAAYAPDEGETLAAAGTLGGGLSQLPDNLIVRSFPGSAPGDVEGYVDPATFRAVFAADLPAKQTRVLAATQRPIALSALETPSGVPAWKTIPSWALLARGDLAIPVEAERVMARRAHSHAVEVKSSHLALISHPEAVTALILAAARQR